MSTFRDSAHAVEFLRPFYEESASHAKFLAGSGAILAYTLTDPEVRIVIDGSIEPRSGHGLDYYINDPNAPAPHVEFFMDADTFHRLHLGEVQPMALVLSGKVKTKGDVSAAMRLLPAMGAAVQMYKAYCAAHPL